ncbi:LOW QUALITY PROTEIN: DNA repair protein XRCC1 [Cuculus canorus]|uniref:LOW QUALITY PROTEIN: DNA repair protein XRCC1 n=1 Tax=Cuculus canorus TaxID=55661 RepID=UPI0023AAF2D6|nr:LOW QUALITY PROTEIN: DNA repair protein XRCC1 [Cuculus canorus]
MEDQEPSSLEDREAQSGPGGGGRAAMPEIPLTRVVSVSSSDPRFPAENLLQPDNGGRWRGAAAGEKQISVVLELGVVRPIHSLHIGNDGAAFVEALVGNDDGDFQVLLPTAAFASPGESRAGVELRRVRLFGAEALVSGAARGGGRRLRLVCSQPYCQSRPFGLSFVRIFSPPEEDEDPPRVPVRRLGPFTVREEGGSPPRPPGALFYRRPPSPPTVPPQDPPGPSYALAALQSSAGADPKPPKRRLTPKADVSPRKRSVVSPKANGSPRGRLSPPAPGPILAGVVLVLSGFQNPLRSRLREAAAAMGAAYRPDWSPDSTHLVCAFPRTPKAALARARGGVVVGPAWIWDCQRHQRRLPCAPYLLDGSGSSGSDDGEGSEAPPPSSPRPPRQPGTPPSSDAAGSDLDETEAERDDPYGGSTEENSEEEEEEEEEEPLPPLPDFFEDKTFFFHGEFPEEEERRLLRYVTAFGGTLSPSLTDAVTHVVTSQQWGPALEQVVRRRPSLTLVGPRWVLRCGERLRELPPQPFLIAPL